MVVLYRVLLSLSYYLLVACQQPGGSLTAEVHPQLTTYKCTTSGGCVAQSSKVVLDANWRWLHGPSPYNNCYTTSNTWDPTLCPDPVSCAKNCYLEGVNYTNYGITTNGNSMTMLMFPPSGSYGTRVYLMSDDSHYQLINPMDQEITFDVDVSGLPCGTNGAVYFTNMAADGGQSAYPNNKAGAKFGTGYCDSQCPQDLHFINGQANMLNWNGNTGRYGSCCHEMDMWESNSAATAYTAHPCSTLGQTQCDSTTSACGKTGNCDHDGCDFNPYRLGNTSFYGYGKTIQTNAPNKIRVITQFKTSDNTATGSLTQIVRTYIQGGKVIYNSASNVKGVSGNSLTDTFCSQEKSAFGETNYFSSKGGMSSMRSAFGNGMVLTMSIWLDYAFDMLWLDSIYPNGSSPSTPGNARGPCASNTGDPGTVNAQYHSSQVTYSNIRWGDIGTTYGPPYV